MAMYHRRARLRAVIDCNQPRNNRAGEWFAMSRRSKTLLAALFALPPAFATAADDDAADGQAQQELLDLLEEQTRIATKTKLNADYVPGMVTVLQGEELEAQGVRTVWEAMGLVPGVDPVIDNLGQRRLLFRGVGNIFFSGNFKVLLNGVPMNSAHKGLADPVLNIPVEQVARIEAIRGPGSAIHGEFAYVGVIDVITRQGDSGAFIGGGSHGERRGGASLSWQSEENDRSFDLNVAGWRRDGTGVTAGTDALYRDPNYDAASVSHAPGPPNETTEAGTAVMHYRDGGFELLGQWSEDAFGDHYGVNHVLPPPEDRRVLRNRIRDIEARHEAALGSGWTTRLRLGHARVTEEKDGQYILPGYEPYDLLYKERRNRAEMDLVWTGSRRHHILAGLSYNDVEVTEAETNYGDYLVEEGRDRRIRSLTLQDEFRVTDRLTVTAGARHDDYSDAGDHLSPRLAGVWRVSDRHVFKAQYGEAFRPPALYESAFELDAPTIETTELGYIYKGIRREARATLFYSELSEPVIYRTTVRQYTNADSARLQGIELDGSMHVDRRTRVGGNLSYVDSEDGTTGRELAGSATWQGNLFASFRPAPATRIDLRLRFLDEYHRDPDDPRGALDGYETLDLTASLDRPWGAAGWSARAGIKNALDDGGRYPARLVTNSYEDLVVSYEDDLPRPGRTWWVQLRYTY